MRVVFMGTPDFAVPALAALIAAGHDIAAVYSQPPRPAGRGHKLQKSPVHLLAESHDIPVRTPVNFKGEDDRQALRDLNADIGIVAAYGLILPRAVLDTPRLGCLNIHGSLLPRWRGAAPIHRALLAGDVETGITIMRMETGLDTGPMLHKKSIAIGPHDTVQKLHDAMAELGSSMLVETLSNLSGYPEIVQPEDGVTYAQKITREEGILCGAETAQKIDAMVRAFTPWPGVWITLKGQRLKLLSGEPLLAISKEGDFGDIYTLDGRMLCAPVSDTGRSVYRIDRLQAPNGKAMSVADAVNGGLIDLCG